MVEQEGSPAVAMRRLADRPYLATVVFLFIYTFIVLFVSILLFGVLNLDQRTALAPLIQQTTFHVLMLFVVTPLVLRLPSGQRSLFRYVDEIRLTHNSPLGRLILLGVTCWLIMALCQLLGSAAFQWSRGWRVDGRSMAKLVDLRHELPPRSMGLINSLPTVFEEIAFRGVILTLFLRHTSRRRAIVCSALAFGVLHLLNLTGQRAPIWVVSQIVWASILGLFYAYVTIECDSLLPTMIVHTLSNAFIGTMTAPIQKFCSDGVQAIYGLTLTLGLLPTLLMTLWAVLLIRAWRRHDAGLDPLLEG